MYIYQRKSVIFHAQRGVSVSRGVSGVLYTVNMNSLGAGKLQSEMDSYLMCIIYTINNLLSRFTPLYVLKRVPKTVPFLPSLGIHKTTRPVPDVEFYPRLQCAHCCWISSIRSFRQRLRRACEATRVVGGGTQVLSTKVSLSLSSARAPEIELQVPYAKLNIAPKDPICNLSLSTSSTTFNLSLSIILALSFAR